MPESVVGDPGRLRQVLVNLVGNAIKFTERGEVVVTVEPEPPAEDAPSALHFSVADTGIGIPAEKRTAIFEPFEQADGSTTRKYGGTGLGLAISARLVGLMGGRIWVEENPAAAASSGSPPGSTASPRPVDLAVAPADRSSTGCAILVVDDNRTNRVILEEILSHGAAARRGRRRRPRPWRLMGRAADRGEPFPLVLLDRMMPGMDGCELAGRIRADPRPRRVPAHDADLRGHRRGVPGRRELGIAAWLAKPVRQSELLDAILDAARAARTPADRPPPEPIAPPSPRPPDGSASSWPRTTRSTRRSATRMLQELGHEVTVVGDGRQASRPRPRGRSTWS